MRRAASNVRLRPKTLLLPRVRALSAPVARELHVLLYSYVDDALEKRAPHRAEHLAAAQASSRRGELLLGGALSEPVDGAVLVFSGGEAAEAFAQSDPYVREGVVSGWTIRSWTAVAGSLHSLLPEPPAFTPTYEWQRVPAGTSLPAGLDVELPLDGVGAQRARIPPCWTLQLWVGDAHGYFRANVEITTTVFELRAAAARHVGVPPERITLRLDGTTVDDASTARELDLFVRQTALEVVLEVE